jgi:hypothetical protein
MADKNTELLEMLMGILVTQATLCRYLVREKVIDRASIVAYLAERRVAWERTASPGALMPIDFVMALIVQQQEPNEVPPAPASLH